MSTCAHAAPFVPHETIPCLVLNSFYGVPSLGRTRLCNSSGCRSCFVRNFLRFGGEKEPALKVTACVAFEMLISQEAGEDAWWEVWIAPSWRIASMSGERAGVTE